MKNFNAMPRQRNDSDGTRQMWNAPLVEKCPKCFGIIGVSCKCEQLKAAIKMYGEQRSAECVCGHEGYEHSKQLDGSGLEFRGMCEIHGCICLLYEQRIDDAAGERADRAYDGAR